MLRLGLAVILTIVVMLFAMANTHHVDLSFVFGAPVKVRLIFLLGSMFFTGMLLSWFLRMIEQTIDRRRGLQQSSEES